MAAAVCEGTIITMNLKGITEEKLRTDAALQNAMVQVVHTQSRRDLIQRLANEFNSLT